MPKPRDDVREELIDLLLDGLIKIETKDEVNDDEFEMIIRRAKPADERSYQAHIRKLGLTVVDEFEFAEQAYYSITFETGIEKVV